MLAKISQKNQLTLPKKIVERLGLASLGERYVDVEVEGNMAVLKPVIVTVEEKFPEDQLEKFHAWAIDHQEDPGFESAEKATEFLKKRMKKK